MENDPFLWRFPDLFRFSNSRFQFKNEFSFRSYSNSGGNSDSVSVAYYMVPWLIPITDPILIPESILVLELTPESAPELIPKTESEWDRSDSELSSQLQTLLAFVQSQSNAKMLGKRTTSYCRRLTRANQIIQGQ